MTIFHDKNGVPIHPGDLLKSLHFVGARRKRYYLYHTVVYDPGRDPEPEMVPTSELEPTMKGLGGRCRLSEGLSIAAEVIQGFGPGGFTSFEDRVRVKPAPA